MILTDDQGFDDVGLRHAGKPANRRLRTPSIDRLAADSVQFEDFYVNPLCAPSRASLLTGRHHLEVGVWGVHGGTDFIDISVPTFAQALGPLGYRTSFFGKWHSGKTDGYYPHNKGFNHSVMAHLYQFRDNTFNVNGEQVQSRGWAEEVMAEYALDYLDDYAASGAAQPFLMYYAPMTPHKGVGPSAPGADYHAPADMIAAYSGRGFSAVMSRLYAAIEFMDTQLGRVLNKLSALGLDSSTVVLFSSDNGPAASGMSRADWELRNPSAMKGSKASVEENGVRQNLFVRWTGTYAPSVIQGSVCSITDILPTMVDLAGGVVSRGQRSLVPLLEQQTDSWFDSRYVYNYRVIPQFGTQTFAYADGAVDKTQRVFDFRPSLSAVRQGDYKLLADELYDLKTKQYVETVPSNNPQVQAGMQRELQRWWNDDVLANPLSFEKPAVQVCYSNQRTSSFYSYMAIAQTGLEVTNHEVLGWDDVGDSLTFGLQVHCAGKYVLEYDLSVASGCAATVKLTIAGVAWAQEVQPRSSIRFPGVVLPKGSTTMKVEIQSLTMASGETNVFSKSTRLTLQREA